MPTMQMNNRDAQPVADAAPLGEPLAHDSAHKHVTGEARYVDDIPRPHPHYHVAVGGSEHAHAQLRAINLTAVRAAAGVVDVITAADIRGECDIGPVFPGEPLLATATVETVGQPIFAVAATSHRAAVAAVARAQIDYEPRVAILDLATALDRAHYVRPPHTMQRGDAEAGLAAAPQRVAGTVTIGGQEHFYLEGQVSLALPGEDGGVEIITSCQNPTETQKLVAQVLAIDMHKVDVITRRMGGAFGGKETQAAPWACLAAVFATRLRAAVSCRLARRDDMVMTGKRHNFRNAYEVGFTADGAITAIRHELAAQCGYAPDLSDAIVDRAMFHADNAYYLPQVQITGLRAKTHTVSNTAFRGFGGPQGMLAMETVIDHIAHCCRQDPLHIRCRNLYDAVDRNVTPYHQQLATCNLATLVSKLAEQSDYWQRREQIRQFNEHSPILKKGLALTPVKFGISFTTAHLNQAGALLHIYTDGSIHLNHGGTEMGQGLLVKVAQIVAAEFGVARATVIVSAARTDKVPNTAPTAASAGTDLNGMAARTAARTIKQRLVEFLAKKYEVAADRVEFRDGHVHIGAQTRSFAQVAQAAWRARVSLSATGFYRTPKVHYHRATARGHPFFYFATGAAACEVIIDRLTGESRLVRADIIHDVGHSINPAIDRGQVEGGFIQGLGWLTSEELVWNAAGRLLSDSPATYKIPAIGDTPPIFNVELLTDANAEPTVFRSKAVGEPPLMLAIAAWCAIRDAIGAVATRDIFPPLNTPATPEEILRTINIVRDAA